MKMGLSSIPEDSDGSPCLLPLTMLLCLLLHGDGTEVAAGKRWQEWECVNVPVGAGAMGG